MTEFKLSDKILNLRRYLAEGGKMIYWQGDDDKNKGIYVDLGAVMGNLKEFINEEEEAIRGCFVSEEQLDIYFPKGDKRRGEVLALLGTIHAKICKAREKLTGF